MIYRKFQDKSLSLLGFGTMRLPLKPGGSASEVDEEQVREMIRYAMENGVNYFDTAYPYHGGESERVTGRLLKEYDRDSFYLATKYPGHQIASTYDPQAVFEEQLEKCQVDYFDFYLLHNVYENSIKVYKDPQWGIVDYFIEQKRQGKIRHLGFSSHGGVDNLKEFLDLYGEHMEFCQIQLNYLDWSLQDAQKKYEILTERNIPVWVMEPLRGGTLANLKEEQAEKLKGLRDESPAAWALRFLQGLPNVTMILSGMSSIEQMKQNVATFEKEKSLSEQEQNLLFELAEGMKNSVPCTACRYCCDGCPKGLDIPMLLSIYNEARILPSSTAGMRIEALAEEKQPAACIACGKCAKVCPQKIQIPEELKAFTEILSKIPSWTEICKQRDEEAKRSRERNAGA
ncbi:MAG: aldo/keto reductase [Lachnospiraceae bacterium]|nr:aldo/keto reductase [Lachnospiraceae bacterium]